MKGSSGNDHAVSQFESNALRVNLTAVPGGTDIGRRRLLQSVFMGLGAASLPAWVLNDVLAAGGGPELDLPLGPLAAQDFGPLVQKAVADNLTGVNHLLFAPAEFDVRLVSRAGVKPGIAHRDGRPRPHQSGWRRRVSLQQRRRLGVYLEQRDHARRSGRHPLCRRRHHHRLLPHPGRHA